LNNKIDSLKPNIYDLEDITLLCMTFYTFFRRSTIFDARKLKVSNTIGIKVC